MVSQEIIYEKNGNGCLRPGGWYKIGCWRNVYSVWLNSGSENPKKMRIVGIGTDITECPRIGRMIMEHGEQFLRRVYTNGEISYCNSRKLSTEHFAGRWAAKEAVLKAIGTGWIRGVSWTDIEIRNEPGGTPRVQLYAGTRDIAEARGVGGMDDDQR